MLVVSVVFAALSTLVVFFRMLSRFAIVKKMGVDDGFMLLAWIIAVGMSFCICYGTAWGLGRHEDEIPDAWQSTFKATVYAFTVMYQPALMAVKTSILAFYLTISTANRNFQWASIATLAVVNAGGFALTMLTVFQCRPVAAIFATVTPATASCTDIVTIYLSSAPLNIITDLAILFLPLPTLTGMRLPRKQKIILIITFSFGVFVAAVDVVRIAYLQKAATTRLSEIQNQTHSDSGSSREQAQTDISWYAAYSFLFTILEVNISIICACVPGLKPLVARLMPNMLRDSGDAPSETGSLSLPIGTVDMQQAQRIPSVPDSVYRRDFGSVSAPQGEDQSMGMMDFLTTPDMAEFPDRIERTNTALTNTSRHTAPGEPTFFDFVNMKGRKSMVHLTNRESVFPVGMVSILFLIWGFEYGLLDVLNQQFQKVAHMTPGQTTGIHSAYFAGYLVGPPLVGRVVLKHWGFKACYSVGLSIFGCGTLIFWPAAVLTSFPAFVITNFIVAFGLSILECAANPFALLCGPAEYAEIRLNISQGIQAIGSVIAPLIANRAFFHRDRPSSLIDTQWAYLGISLATILLAVGYYYVPLPEVTDEELECAAERMDRANKASIGRVNVIWITLGFGLFGQFCYVGAQEAVATGFDSYLQLIEPDFIAANYMAIAHTAFAVSRFLAAGLGFWLKPRILLLLCFTGCILFSALAMSLSGNTGVACLIMVFFFEGPIFALIFGQALRGMGKHTKLASISMTSAISGGAVFSPIAKHLTFSSRGAQYSLVVAVAVFAAGAVFAVALNGNAKIRAQVDPISDATTPDSSRPGSTSSRASRALSFIAMGKKAAKDLDGGTEWRERKPNELAIYET